ncbi:MAG: response regulator [Deltaproteobacteria bacterium]|nr:response regulator [Deltaproteobacteria bacterium]
MIEELKIIVVSNDVSSRKMFVGAMKTIPQLQVKEAENGDEALTLIRKSEPDIIVSDLEIPIMDDPTLFGNITRNGRFDSSDIYLILIGNEDSKERRSRCISEGADDYLCKPVTPDELIIRVKIGLRIISELKRKRRDFSELLHEFDILLIQDGGCAPGYNPVTAFITYHLETLGRKVYATREGFKSLVSGGSNDFIRLVYNPELFKTLNHTPGVFHAAPLSESRGALLRGERFKGFLKKENQEKAAEVIQKKNVKAIIAIGGNGTFRGTLTLCGLIPTSIQVFFIPVTIDSDIAGTQCIGENTGIEKGSEKILCYMADARTHKRTYIVEMMGASSGFHALHSCLGSRAHLAVLPNSDIDHEKVVDALNKREECVIVVAEGYKEEERKAKGLKDNAAQYFHKELLATGIEIKRKVVCEAFSRDIRGAAPNNQDITLAQRMAYNVAAYLEAGTSRLMPAVRSGKEYAIPFNQIGTDNMVEEDLLVLSDRLTKG